MTPRTEGKSLAPFGFTFYGRLKYGQLILFLLVIRVANRPNSGTLLLDVFKGFSTFSGIMVFSLKLENQTSMKT